MPDAAERLADLVEDLAQRTKIWRRKEMKLPREVGPIHFIGIGGIGMSGIAEVMATLGYQGARLGSRRQLQHRAAAQERHCRRDRP